MLKKFAADYFSFTRKERRGILVLISLILLFTALPFFYPFFIREKKYDHSVFEKEIAALKFKEADSSGKDSNEYNEKHTYPAAQNKYYETRVKGELFYFDPNTLSTDGWKKLGVRDKTIITIQKYIAKGGKFYKAEDIGKIWGLHEDEVQRLLPFVSIKEKTTTSYNENKYPTTGSYKSAPKKILTIDINAADTTAFIALPGIGSKLANRIINFRDKLGGFYNVDQVAETFGLADSTFQKIKQYLILPRPEIKKININTAAADEMKLHPYIRYNLATAIVQYRTQHGKFLSIDGIKKIMMVTDEIYNKLSPYLVIE